jgi:hypothetical protein
MKINVRNWRNLSSKDKHRLIEFAIHTNSIKLKLAKKYR